MSLFLSKFKHTIFQKKKEKFIPHVLNLEGWLRPTFQMTSKKRKKQKKEEEY